MAATFPGIFIGILSGCHSTRINFGGFCCCWLLLFSGSGLESASCRYPAVFLLPNSLGMRLNTHIILFHSNVVVKDNSNSNIIKSKFISEQKHKQWRFEEVRQYSN